MNLWLAFSLSLLFHLSLLLIPDRPAGRLIGGGSDAPLNAILHGVKLAVVTDATGTDITSVVETGAEFRDDSNKEFGQNQTKQPSDSIGVPLIPPALQPNVPETSNPVAPAVPELTSYFRRSELTVPPAMQDEPLIDISENIGRTQKGGKLALRLYIGHNGAVDRIEVVSSNLSTDVEEIVKAAFMPLRFKPGEINGLTVNSQIVFEIDLDGPTKGASRSSDQASWNVGHQGSGKPDGFKGR